MASLSAHLREPGDHGRLAFHPECPVCRRDRLAGTLPADALVSRRTQAVLTAGVLALSSTAPTPALAGEPDQEREGTAPEHTSLDTAGNPEFDPGGESTDLPFDAGPVDTTAADAADEVGVLEQESAANETAPVADPGDVGTPGASAPQAPATTDTVPAPLPTSQAAQPAPAPEPSTATATPPDPEAGAPARARLSEDTLGPSRRTPVAASTQTERSEPSAQAETVVVPSEPSEATTVNVAQEPSASGAATSQAAGREARPGDRVHVVVAGESLWSIAKDVLGDDVSIARVAREVNRLWSVNRERIGTGDPDLVMVGTRLTLR